MNQKPSVGRIVHYFDGQDPGQADKRQPYAAIITHVHSDTVVNLAVLSDGQWPVTRKSETPDGVFYPVHVSMSEDDVPMRRWCWPPRV